MAPLSAHVRGSAGGVGAHAVEERAEDDEGDGDERGRERLDAALAVGVEADGGRRAARGRRCGRGLGLELVRLALAQDGLGGLRHV
jgi:hypothetical protein